jgi:5-guanidino-2-oxopentanoate decarboxylase
VITTVNGKGVVDERHPLSLGASIRLRAAQRFLAERDVVLAVGSELGESDLWGPVPELGGKLIRVDIDPAQRDKNVRADVAVTGDARAVLGALAESVPARAAEDLGAVREAIRAEALADGASWLPLMGALDEALGPDGILAGDSTKAAYYGAVHFLAMDARRRFAYPTGYATLGYALPAAIGAKLAAPERPVIALIGDGGLLFTVSELATAAELGLPLPVVVPNNGGYGEIRDQMVDAGVEPVGVDLRVPDLPKLGEAFGGAGLRIEHPGALAPVLREALERPGPTVIEVPAA